MTRNDKGGLGLRTALGVMVPIAAILVLALWSGTARASEQCWDLYADPPRVDCGREVTDNLMGEVEELRQQAAEEVDERRAQLEEMIENLEEWLENRQAGFGWYAWGNWFKSDLGYMNAWVTAASTYDTGAQQVHLYGRAKDPCGDPAYLSLDVPGPVTGTGAAVSFNAVGTAFSDCTGPDVPYPVTVSGTLAEDEDDVEPFGCISDNGNSTLQVTWGARTSYQADEDWASGVCLNYWF